MEIEYPILEVAGKKEPTQAERLMEIDQWMKVLFVQMDFDYRTMHRLPKNLEHSTPTSQ